MSELLSINGTHFISASDAGKICKYTSDYVTKLAREGKIEAKRMGRQWYVSPESLEVFLVRSKEQKEVRSKKISKERKRELYVFSKNPLIKIEEIEVSAPIESKNNTLMAIQQTAVILTLGITVGLGGYFVAGEFPAAGQEAAVIESDLNPLERLALALYRFIGPREGKQYAIIPTRIAFDGGTSSDAPPQGASTTTEDIRVYNSIVVAPSELFTEAQVAEVRESFSDQVEVSIDPNNPDTGLIVPIFKDRRGDEYRYLLMPLDPGGNSGT